MTNTKPPDPVRTGPTDIPCREHAELLASPQFAFNEQKARAAVSSATCMECWASNFECPCCGACTSGMVMTTKCCLICTRLLIRLSKLTPRCPVHTDDTTIECREDHHGDCSGGAWCQCKCHPDITWACSDGEHDCPDPEWCTCWCHPPGPGE